MPSKEKFLESLDIVGSVVPIAKSIISDGSYLLKSKKSGDFLQVEKIVKIYSILKKNKELSGRNLEALCFYLQEGYNKDQKDKMAKQLGIKTNNVNQINTTLRKMGYLIVDDKNQTKNSVVPELQKMKDRLIDKETKNLIIEFI